MYINENECICKWTELIEENSRLHEQLRELQRLAEEERARIVELIREAEAGVEEERSRAERQTAQLADDNRELRAKLEALDKQFRANKDYLEVSLLVFAAGRCYFKYVCMTNLLTRLPNQQLC